MALKTSGFLGEHTEWIEPFCDPVYPSNFTKDCKVKVDIGKEKAVGT